MPVYIISGKVPHTGVKNKLVRADSKSQAIRYVSQELLTAEVAKGETIAELMASGVKCEDARAPETAELTLGESDRPTSGNPGSHTGLSTSSSGGDSPSVAPSSVMKELAETTQRNFSHRLPRRDGRRSRRRQRHRQSDNPRN